MSKINLRQIRGCPNLEFRFTQSKFHTYFANEKTFLWIETTQKKCARIDLNCFDLCISQKIEECGSLSDRLGHVLIIVCMHAFTHQVGLACGCYLTKQKHYLTSKHTFLLSAQVGPGCPRSGSTAWTCPYCVAAVPTVSKACFWSGELISKPFICPIGLVVVSPRIDQQHTEELHTFPTLFRSGTSSNGCTACTRPHAHSRVKCANTPARVTWKPNLSVTGAPECAFRFGPQRQQTSLNFTSTG